MSCMSQYSLRYLPAHLRAGRREPSKSAQPMWTLRPYASSAATHPGRPDYDSIGTEHEAEPVMEV